MTAILPKKIDCSNKIKEKRQAYGISPYSHKSKQLADRTQRIVLQLSDYLCILLKQYLQFFLKHFSALKRLVRRLHNDSSPISVTIRLLGKIVV